MNKDQTTDFNKKRRLFNAATRLFAEKGFEKTTVDEIADAAGVAKGTVYYYFKSKENLFLFLVEEGMNILKQKIITTVEAEADIREGLRQLIKVQLTFFEEYQDICRIILTEAWGISSRQEKLQELLNEYYALLNRIIERGIKQEIVYAQNQEVVSACFFGTTVITALHFLRKAESVDWEAIREQLERLLFRGVVIPV